MNFGCKTVGLNYSWTLNNNIRAANSIDFCSSSVYFSKFQYHAFRVEADKNNKFTSSMPVLFAHKKMKLFRLCNRFTIVPRCWKKSNLDLLCLINKIISFRQIFCLNFFLRKSNRFIRVKNNYFFKLAVLPNIDVRDHSNRNLVISKII